ncbi:MAG: hypothetical protein WEA77_15655 [Hyphomonas sp.]|uniref:hypothetical protein n=1 Tax=Hyphomonas sp. TaxID=87 RepID=UPI0034A0323D
MKIRTLAAALTIAGAVAAPGALAMDEAAFKKEIWPANPSNPHQVNARLQQLIESGELSDDQHARALFQIALNFGAVAHDRTRAAKTYEALLAHFPGHALAEKAAANRDYANTQLGYIRARLKKGPVEAADLMANGQWADVASHFGKPGFVFLESDLPGLCYTGWFCEPGMMTAGPTNTEQKAIGPCSAKQDPVNIPALKILD